MARVWIVVGDATDGGGRVVSGTPFTDVDGKPVARVGDKATCPKHKGTFPIVSGDPTIVIDGHAVARHGDKVACGCTLISGQQQRAFVDQGSSGSSGGRSSRVQTGASIPAVASFAAAGASAMTAGSKRYDQAVRFVNESGQPLAQVDYKLYLADGTTSSGTTNAAGTTARVQSVQQQAIVRAELIPIEQASPCCAVQGKEAASFTITLPEIHTTSTELGTSVEEVQASGHERPLTPGEITMSRLIFGDSVDYSKVKVHNHGYWLLFGLQDKDTAVTPNGEMYFPEGVYREDYSKELDEMQAWFLHEMTHVWQYQLGYPIKRVRTPRPNMSYDYNLESGKLFHEFNMEAQGDIIWDYYLVRFRSNQIDLRARRYAFSAGLLQRLSNVLAKFLADPKDKANLPTTTE